MKAKTYEVTGSDNGTHYTIPIDLELLLARITNDEESLKNFVHNAGQTCIHKKTAASNFEGLATGKLTRTPEQCVDWLLARGGLEDGIKLSTGALDDVASNQFIAAVHAGCKLNKIEVTDLTPEQLALAAERSSVIGGWEIPATLDFHTLKMSHAAWRAQNRLALKKLKAKPDAKSIFG